MNPKQNEENKFKQVWGNKRSRAMIQLAGYVLFFILVGVIIDFEKPYTSYLEGESSPSHKVSFSNYDNYEFYYNITYLGLADEPVKYINIDGYRNLQKQFFMVRDTLEKYYMEDHVLYEVKDDFTEVTNPFIFSLQHFSPDLLETYIGEAKLNSKTEYADKVIKKEYVLSTSSFASLYQGHDTKMDGNVDIITYEKDKMIYKVELNLESYNKMKYELNYKNIGKVAPFSREDVLSFSHTID